jgi:peroxiredoxin
MRNWKILTLLTLAVIVGAFLVGRLSSNRRAEVTTAQAAVASAPASAAKRGTEVGNLAPEFQLARMDGSTLSLGDLRGQPSVLVFWAAWCPFCKEEAPHVNKLSAEYEARGVRVFGIDVHDSQARTEWGVRDFGIRYPVVRDADGNAARNYNVEGIPTVIFLDRKGVVRYVGNRVANDYSERLDALLAEKE